MRFERLDTAATTVGEGPVWDGHSQSLFFVDVVEHYVHRFATASGTTTSWKMGQPVGSLALRERGGAIVSLKEGVFALDFDSGGLAPLALASEMDQTLQLNDGKTDRRGRFVVGGGDFLHNATNQIAPLYSLGTEGGLRVIETGIGMTNGPCWSPGDETFYFSDTSRRQIYAYDYDIETGAISDRRVFVDMRSDRGVPDGATVDRDGLVWVAICGGGKIVAYRPDGKLERVVEAPCAYPTSVMFGGPRLDQLFVTSLDARFVNAPADDGGSTFVLTGLGASGIAETPFGG